MRLSAERETQTVVRDGESVAAAGYRDGGWQSWQVGRETQTETGL